MSRTRISVALCTFNGEAFLQEQLESIEGQTRLADEIVICDDGSTDTTLEIVEAFRSRTTTSVRVQIQTSNQGVTKNFEQAISNCTGDLIALCIQDDVWHPEKLSRMETELLRHPDWAMAFHDLELVDAHLNPLGQTFWQSIGFGSLEQSQMGSERSWEILLRRPVVTGAGAVFRTTYRDALIPITGCWIHDGWISMILAGISCIGCVPEVLTQYRQHGSNVIGGQRKSAGEYLTETMTLDTNRQLHQELERTVTAAARLGEFPAAHPEFLTQLHEKRRFLEARMHFPGSRAARIPYILRQWPKYRRFGRGLKVALKDLLRPA